MAVLGLSSLLFLSSQNDPLTFCRVVLFHCMQSSTGIVIFNSYCKWTPRKMASIVTFRMLCSGERVIVMWKNWIYLYYSLGWICPYQFIAYGFYPSEVFFRFFLCVIQLSKNYEIVSYQASYVSRLMIGLFSLEIQRVEPKDGKSHNLMLFFIELYFVMFF